MACAYTVFPAPFVEQTIPCPLNGLHTLAENHLTIWNGLFLDSLSYSIGLYIWLNASTTLDHDAFVLNFEIRKYETFNFVLPFKDYFGYSASLRVHVNLRMEFSISAKNIVGIMIGIVLNLLITLGSIAILPILSLPVHEHGCFSIYLYLL